MKILGWILILPAVWMIVSIFQVILFNPEREEYGVTSFISLIITLAFAGIMILTNCGGK